MKITTKYAVVIVVSTVLAACGSQGSKDNSEAGSTGGSTTSATGSSTGSSSSSSSSTGSTGSGSDTKTAQIAVTGGVGMPTLGYSLLRTNAAAAATGKGYTLAISTYNLCGWGIKDGFKGYPNNGGLLGLYLLNQTAGVAAAPVAGTYNIQTPTAGATGMFIDPKVSGYSLFNKSCTGTFPALSSGSVVVTTVAADGNLTGTLTLKLSDGSSMSGSFTTVSTCSGSEADGTDGTATECKWPG